MKYDHEFNVLDIENFRKNGPHDALYNFIRLNHSSMEGDIVESGVYRGRSLLAIALLLKELGSDKKVYGYDSFSGFPPVYHANDEFEVFSNLFAQGRISKQHYDAVQKNNVLKSQLVEQEVSLKNISKSNDFSKTSKQILEKKIEILELDNIVLVEGAFQDTMMPGTGPSQIFACMMDCDLYKSYIETFDFIWPKLVRGGMVYLDEYFSLKFPGARVATDEFLLNKPHNLQMNKISETDLFERWHVIKTYN